MDDDVLFDLGDLSFWDICHCFSGAAMIIRETADQYHAREAVSASLLWSIVKPDGCLAKARHESRWLNPDFVEPPDQNKEFGEVVHLAALEKHLLDDRVALWLGDNWLGNEAADFARGARLGGKVPLLKHRTSKTPKTRYTFDEVLGVRKALEQNKEIAGLLFGEGESEVTYTWEIPAVASPSDPLGQLSTPCKARADRIVRGAIADLKTAECASWGAFQRAMERDGHHLRAAWYLDGWFEGGDSKLCERFHPRPDYKFVVIEKKPPYLSAIWPITPRALEWGRKWNARALRLLRESMESDKWPSYQPPGNQESREVPLRNWLEWDYADYEKAGLL